MKRRAFIARLTASFGLLVAVFSTPLSRISRSAEPVFYYYGQPHHLPDELVLDAPERDRFGRGLQKARAEDLIVSGFIVKFYSQHYRPYEVGITGWEPLTKHD